MNQKTQLSLSAWIFLACLGHSVHAQFETNGPSASLTMQTEVASIVDPIGHDVDVAVPGTFTITIDSGTNPNAGIIMLASIAPLVGPQFATPWGGSIDVGAFNQGLGSIVPIADGIGLSVNPIFDVFYRTSAPLGVALPNRFDQILTVPAVLCGARSAWQAVVADPTATPFGLDNTEAADANFLYRQRRTLLTGDDGVASAVFAPGHSFPFHGIVYTDVFVCGNGFVSFGAPTTVASQGFTIDTASWVGSEPSIAVALADWDIDAFDPRDGVFFDETGDSVAGVQIEIVWGDPRALPSGRTGVAHSGANDVNRFGITLRGDVTSAAPACTAPAAVPGTFEIYWPTLAAPVLGTDANGAFGHTPGGLALATSGAVPLSRDLLGGPASTGLGVAAVEEHDATGTNASIVGFDGLGTPRGFNLLQAASGLSLTFTPNAGGVPGAFGYSSTPSAPPADVVLGPAAGSLPIGGATPTTITIVGKFFGFGAGTVTATESTGAVIPATSATVVSGTGPFFAAEQLVVVLPPILSGPTSTLTINFATGSSQSIVVPANNVCSGTTIIPLAPNGAAVFTLQTVGPIDLYGSLYSSLIVHENGLITTVAPTGATVSTLAGFFGGFGAPGNVAVAPLFCNLRAGVAPSTVSVIQDACIGSVTVVWDNQFYFNSGSPAGRFSVEFLPGGNVSLISFDYTGLINDTGPFDTAVVGISDGMTSVPPFGVDTNLANVGGIAAVFPGYASNTSPDSIGEDISTAVVATVLQSIVGTGGPGRFSILNNFGFLFVL